MESLNPSLHGHRAPTLGWTWNGGGMPYGKLSYETAAFCYRHPSSPWKSHLHGPSNIHNPRQLPNILQHVNTLAPTKGSTGTTENDLNFFSTSATHGIRAFSSDDYLGKKVYMPLGTLVQRWSTGVRQNTQNRIGIAENMRLDATRGRLQSSTSGKTLPSLTESCHRIDSSRINAGIVAHHARARSSTYHVQNTSITT